MCCCFVLGFFASFVGLSLLLPMLALPQSDALVSFSRTKRQESTRPHELERETRDVGEQRCEASWCCNCIRHPPNAESNKGTVGHVACSDEDT